jgi:hypothetical protein
MTSVYAINKGVNKSVEFKGLKAQYIWFLGGGLLALLILYALMYVIGVNSYVCIAVILGTGVFLFTKVYALSAKYGEFGLMKKTANRLVPRLVKSNSRQIFFFTALK